MTHIFADACNDSVAPVTAGTTAAELANALAAQQGHSSSAVTDVTVGGFPAKRIELVLPADVLQRESARFLARPSGPT